jgi:small nuclear ribonucleoprotein (snRNP)-like protein
MATARLEDLRGAMKLGVVGRRVRVEIADGRIFVGELQCFDGEQNLIMERTIEHRIGDVEGDNERDVGMVMVPGRELVKCELESSALAEFDSTVRAMLTQS